jgi:hypothetical protein
MQPLGRFLKAAAFPDGQQGFHVPGFYHENSSSNECSI